MNFKSKGNMLADSLPRKTRLFVAGIDFKFLAVVYRLENGVRHLLSYALSDILFWQIRDITLYRKVKSKYPCDYTQKTHTPLFWKSMFRKI